MQLLNTIIHFNTPFGDHDFKVEYCWENDHYNSYYPDVIEIHPLHIIDEDTLNDVRDYLELQRNDYIETVQEIILKQADDD